jgi:RNA polymerase sigma-70 factor (ECF subfamily)
VALDALFRRHVDDLYRFCLRLTWSDVASAEDLAQETLLTAIRNIRKFRETSSFRTWLLGIAHNLQRNDLRSEQTRRRKLREVAGGQAVAARGADQVAGRDEERGLIQGAFQSLAPGQRDAVYLRDILGCSYEETAEVLGISANAVKNRIYEGRKRMVNFINERIGRDGGLKIGHG